jgi:hypothetical protein
VYSVLIDRGHEMRNNYKLQQIDCNAELRHMKYLHFCSEEALGSKEQQQ